MRNVHKAVDITNSVFAFGSSCGPSYGMMVLRDGGAVAGYHHPNEARWHLDGNTLVFLTRAGQITSKLDRVQGANVFIGSAVGSNWPLYVLPVISHITRHNCSLPSIFINSLPKSGTYFLEAVLSALGWRPTRLHLADGGAVDDYRNLSDDEMHVAPEAVRIPCPTRCLGALLGHGEIVVGHLSNQNEIHDLIGEGLLEIRVIRDLRDILFSLFRFKLKKVIPLPEQNETWRNEDNPRQITEFFQFFLDKDIKNIIEQAKYFSESNSFMTVRFEDLIKFESSDLESFLEFRGISKEKYSSVLKKTMFTDTSTWSGRISSWEDIWHDDLENLFVNSGLYDLNIKLGYK